MFTRNDMAKLLVHLRGMEVQEALSLVKTAWATVRSSSRLNSPQRLEYSPMIGQSLPPILQKIINMDEKQTEHIGFSMNDIVSLGNQMEYANLSTTTVQNWIKRDVKDLIATPQAGKKYSVEQVATIFIIEDLKSSLDFDSIRRILSLIFNDPRSDDDDVIHPVDFLAAYAKIYEALRNSGVPIVDVIRHAHEFSATLTLLSDDQRSSVEHAITVAVLSLQASSFQTAARAIAASVVIDKQLS